jgi:hypothetical protein
MTGSHQRALATVCRVNVRLAPSAWCILIVVAAAYLLRPCRRVRSQTSIVPSNLLLVPIGHWWLVVIVVSLKATDAIVQAC